MLLKPVQQAPALATAGTARTCTNTQLSCHNTSAVADTCCFNQPGGQLLLTQFWDTAPATGPVDSWTVHGLWPDRCDGTYESYCDRRRRYDDIGATIHDEEPRLFEYMSVYWKDYKGDDEQLWEHEWNKHGTCISTLEPRCYDAYTPREEMVDYFRRTMELFRGLDTYQVSSKLNSVWLLGIIPLSPPLLLSRVAHRPPTPPSVLTRSLVLSHHRQSFY